MWDLEAENTFKQLKRYLTNALFSLSDEGTLILDTNASGVPTGVVLSQKQGSEENVIAYFRRSLFDRTQRQYCTTRRELLAVVKSPTHFHHHLYGRNVNYIRIDHFSSLRWLVNFKNAEGQFARWLQKIQQYDLKIEHQPGKYDLNADALSRPPCLRGRCKGCDRAESREQKTSEVE